MKEKEMNVLSKLVSAFIVAALVVTMTGIGNRVVDAETANASVQGKVVVSVEKFTIGQGFVLEPVIVEYTGETSVSQIFDKAMKAAGIEYTATTTQYGTYVSSIKNADNGKVNIPSAISAMEKTEQTWTDPVSYLDPPTNDNLYGNDDYPDLGEYSYYSQSGWMFTRNGNSVNSLEETVSDGDVVRCQFTVYGYGADIGIGWGTPANVVLPEKEVLLTTIACANSDKYLSYASCRDVYHQAVAAAASYDVSKAEIDAVTRKLTIMMAEAAEVPTIQPTIVVQEPTTTPETTAESSTKKVTVKKAAVSKVTNVKGKKAKVTLKKVAGASRYQIRYSTTKKFKSRRTVTVKKLSYTIRNLKKGKTYYVKARAVKIVNGTRYYGSWSKVKKVVIRK